MLLESAWFCPDGGGFVPGDVPGIRLGMLGSIIAPVGAAKMPTFSGRDYRTRQLDT